jgi:Spy/CpxP family protein refolding chaperone
MSKLRYAVVIGAILALAATAFAQAPPTSAQPGMSAQQGQATVPGQQPQPATPGQQPSAPVAPDRSQNAPSAGAAASPADRATDQLAAVLSLSEGQKSQVRSVFQEEHSQLIALQNDAKLSPQDKQTKLTDIRRTASDKVMAILTPEQQKKLTDAIQSQQPQTPAPQKPPQ